MQLTGEDGPDRYQGRRRVPRAVNERQGREIQTSNKKSFQMLCTVSVFEVVGK